jgi:CPA2 family monovalent cation:H+ antiporter-2
MFLAPYMTAHAVTLSERLLAVFGLSRRSREPAKATEKASGRPDRILIIGFGPAGQRVADVLTENGILVAVIELNPETAAIARRKGLKVHLADATNSETISEIGIRGACLVIITVPDPRSAKEIIHNVRLFSPDSTIFARSRYHMASESLGASGATVVIDEEFTLGDELSTEIMASFWQVNRNALACALLGEKP